jgi:hypothetical protein
MLLDRRVEALIILANWLFVDIDIFADLEKRSIPTVVIGRRLQTETVSSVNVDNEIGAYSAIEHLCTSWVIGRLHSSAGPRPWLTVGRDGGGSDYLRKPAD